MNRLSRAERAQVIRALVEGNSIRSINRMTGFAQNTIMKLLVDIGDAASEYQDRTLRNLTSTRIECDEIWAFVHAKARNVPEQHAGEFGYGDVWTWMAIDPDSKLIPTWLVATRDEFAAHQFIADLGSRLANRVQITTDGHRPYLAAIEAEFGPDVDYAQLVKSYGRDGGEGREVSQARKYSPSKVTSQEVHVIAGDPDPALVSTSYVERHNLTMRMGIRRFTRLTNAFSKKVRNHAAAVALDTLYYNFARPHRSLNDPYPRTPAMAAGVADHIWTCEEIAALLD
ncbi:MAG: DDE-type integrase/transposase/recombinase [Chloroflexi bacterium]|nr:DDE-type integrase/transposase/recombinase [Chloroflexota bacterium]